VHLKRLLNLAPSLTGERLHSLPLLVLYLTDGCNSRCTMCDIWQNPRKNMPLALVDSLADACGELGVKHVLLSGGEAMQHPQWPGIAARFRSAGARVMLLTNALYLRKQADDVIANVDEVIVSLDAGTPATYEAIRGVDAFDLVLDGVRALRSAGLPVTTRSTIQRLNYHEMPQIVDTALAVDVNTISFLAVDVANDLAFGQRDLGQPVQASPALQADDIDPLASVLDDLEARYVECFQSGRIAESPTKLRRTLLDYFGALHGLREFAAPRCNAPHFSTVVGVDGTLQPCYFLPAYGRLQPHGAPLPDAINWDAARQLRQAYRQGQRRECARCVCPLYKSPRNLVQM
jgi:Fe-coproporphyrin III synthase